MFALNYRFRDGWIFGARIEEESLPDRQSQLQGWLAEELLIAAPAHEYGGRKRRPNQTPGETAYSGGNALREYSFTATNAVSGDPTLAIVNGNILVDGGRFAAISGSIARRR